MSMKFITEDELRELYFKNPFNKYEIKKNTRLTPGARQFLIDFKISFNSEDEKKFHKKTSQEINNDDRNIKLAITIKNFALEIKSFDKTFSKKLSYFSYKIYNNENIGFEIKNSQKINLEKTYIEMDLDNPNIEIIGKTLKFLEVLDSNFSKSDKNIGLLKNIINIWIIDKIERGDKN